MTTRNKVLLILAAAMTIAAAAPAASPQPAPGRRPLWTRFLTRRFDRSLLQDGFRAATVPVDGAQIKHLRTGDRVDVLATFDARLGTGEQRVGSTILQNVTVLGVDMPRKGESKGGLILLLNPYETEYAALAVHQSELSIALRGEGDAEVYPMEMASFAKLFR